MSSLYVRVWYAATVAFIACAAFAFSSVMYTNHVQQQSEARWAEQRRLADQRWCRLFAIMNPSDAPPTTERGRLIADEIKRMSREDFRCPPK